MNKFFYMVFLVCLLLSPVAFGGDFEFISINTSGAWYTYTGHVDDTDADKLRDVMLNHPDRIVFITINSPGGSAFGGLALFWEAEMWSNLVTIAGKECGAWSAAALFWLGSPRDWFEGEEARVGFHQAYCNPWAPPGCDIQPFRDRLVEALNQAGYCGDLFDAWLTDTQQVFGVNGWALLTDEGWYFYLPRYELKVKMVPLWEI